MPDKKTRHSTKDRQNILNRLVSDETEDIANRPDDGGMTTKAFFKSLEKLADAAERLNVLADDLQSLKRTGLQEQDVVNLIYGRNHDLTKRDIKAVREVLGKVTVGLNSKKRRTEMLVDLVAERSSIGKKKTRQVFEEISRLANRYASDE